MFSCSHILLICSCFTCVSSCEYKRLLNILSNTQSHTDGTTSDLLWTSEGILVTGLSQGVKRRQGGTADGREEIEGSRQDRAKDGGNDRGSESDAERQRGREREPLWHMWKERVVVGRQQLEGTINSPDTSFHITAEHWDRRRAGTHVRVEEEGALLRNGQTSVEEHLRNTRRQPGAETKQATVSAWRGFRRKLACRGLSNCLSLKLFSFQMTKVKDQNDSNSFMLNVACVATSAHSTSVAYPEIFIPRPMLSGSMFSRLGFQRWKNKGFFSVKLGDVILPWSPRIFLGSLLGCTLKTATPLLPDLSWTLHRKLLFAAQLHKPIEIQGDLGRVWRRLKICEFLWEVCKHNSYLADREDWTAHSNDCGFQYFQITPGGTIMYKDAGWKTLLEWISVLFFHNQCRLWMFFCIFFTELVVWQSLSWILKQSFQEVWYHAIQSV